MGSSKGQQTQVVNADPWRAQQPFLTQGFQQAQQLYDQGGGLVAPFSATTQNALGGIEQRAAAGSPILQAGQQAIQQAAGGGFQGADPASGYYRSLMGGGQVNPALGLAGGMAQGGSTNPALAMLQQTANGSMLNANPYLDRMYGQAAGNLGRQFRESVTPGIDSSYARAGRLGSNAFATARNTADRSLGDALGSLATNIYGGNYAQERQNQIGAQQTIGTLANADFANRQNAINLFGQLGQQGIANQASGALGLSNAFDAERARQQQAALASPQMAGADYGDYARLLEAGQMRDTLAQSQLEEPWQRLQQYWGIVGQPLGTSQQSMTPTSRNRLAGGVGGAASGALMGAQLGSVVPGIGTGIGAAGGALLGGITGLFG